MIPAPTDAVERVNYFAGQLLTADDMLADQHYHREARRRHNRFLHGWGVVCGCEVEAAPAPGQPWRVRVRPGYLVTPLGDEVAVGECTYFDLAGDWIQAGEPCPPHPCPPVGAMPHPGRTDPVYLAVKPLECRVRPTRLHPAGCGCEEVVCDFSRVRESIELGLLWEPSPAHVAAEKADAAWRALVLANPGRLPTPPCSPPVDDEWVVLAAITLPKSAGDELDPARIDPGARRVLPGTQRIQQLLDGVPATPGLQAGWRWCNTCQAVFDGADVTSSLCPAGGIHRPPEESGSASYGVFVTVTPPAAQAGWKKCRNCKSLVYGARPGRCPSGPGAAHDKTGSADYSVLMGVPAPAGGQAEWRFCDQCDVLHFGPRVADSTCPAGGRHAVTPSGYYSLMFTGS